MCALLMSKPRQSPPFVRDPHGPGDEHAFFFTISNLWIHAQRRKYIHLLCLSASAWASNNWITAKLFLKFWQWDMNTSRTIQSRAGVTVELIKHALNTSAALKPERKQITKKKTKLNRSDQHRLWITALHNCILETHSGQHAGTPSSAGHLPHEVKLPPEPTVQAASIIPYVTSWISNKNSNL